jgi:hypothetical protein
MADDLGMSDVRRNVNVSGECHGAIIPQGSEARHRTLSERLDVVEASGRM